MKRTYEEIDEMFCNEVDSVEQTLLETYRQESLDIAKNYFLDEASRLGIEISDEDKSKLEQDYNIKF